MTSGSLDGISVLDLSDDVLSELLHLDEDELQALRQASVI